MNIRAQSPKVWSDNPTRSSGNFAPALREKKSCSLLQTIPPERIGLHGEYDHSGLAKRVLLAFQTQFPTRDLSELRVLQRGRVVVLMGLVSSRALLDRLIEIAYQVDGAIDVETNGVRVRPS